MTKKQKMGCVKMTDNVESTKGIFHWSCSNKDICH